MKRRRWVAELLAVVDALRYGLLVAGVAFVVLILLYRPGVV